MNTERLGKDFIPDRTLETEMGEFYIEHERGTHNPATIKVKLKNYLGYFRATKEQFCVLFTVMDEESLVATVKLFEEMNCSGHYFAAVVTDIINDPLQTRLTNRFSTKTFANMLSIT